MKESRLQTSPRSSFGVYNPKAEGVQTRAAHAGERRAKNPSVPTIHGILEVDRPSLECVYCKADKCRRHHKVHAEHNSNVMTIASMHVRLSELGRRHPGALLLVCAGARIPKMYMRRLLNADAGHTRSVGQSIQSATCSCRRQAGPYARKRTPTFQELVDLERLANGGSKAAQRLTASQSS